MNNDQMPLASLLVVFYNQENFVKDTIRGALSQTYSNLEIIFSDDCSTDGTFLAIKDAVKYYKGPHRVILNRNESNIGIVPHVNKVLFELSHGEYIFLNGGDDVSTPNRIKDSLEIMSRLGVDSLSLNMTTINEANEYQKKLFYADTTVEGVYTIDDYIKGTYKQVPGASRVITRQLLDFYGPFNDDAQTEDTTLNFRALLYSGLGYSGNIGLEYRVHSSNISSFSNIYKFFDYNAIHKQYSKDLIIANDKKKITEKQFSEIKEIIDKWLEIQLLKKDIFQRKNSVKIFSSIVKILCSNNLSLSEKKKIFRFVLSCFKFSVRNE